MNPKSWYAILDDEDYFVDKDGLIATFGYRQDARILRMLFVLASFAFMVLVLWILRTT
jgi:hypothetical protein